MSMTGKVLAVLVTLVTVVWIILSACLAQYNRNGTKAVDDLKKQFAKLEADLLTAQHGLQELKDKTYQEQKETENDLTVLQERQSDVEKALSEVIEIKTRVKYQLDGAEANVKAAESHKDLRIAQKKNETEEKAKAEAEVEQLKAQRTELVAQLTALRDKFKSTLDENKALVDRLIKGGRGSTRPATLVH
jgi:chromosome segregation ATPase